MHWDWYSFVCSRIWNPVWSDERRNNYLPAVSIPAQSGKTTVNSMIPPLKGKSSWRVFAWWDFTFLLPTLPSRVYFDLIFIASSSATHSHSHQPNLYTHWKQQKRCQWHNQKENPEHKTFFSGRINLRFQGAPEEITAPAKLLLPNSRTPRAISSITLRLTLDYFPEQRTAER